MQLSFGQHLGKWGFLILRLVVAAIFFYHGLQKLSYWTIVPEETSDTMLFLFRFLSIAEPIAAATLIIGFWTQIASFGLSLVMVAAIYYKIQIYRLSFSGDKGGWEFELALLAACVVLAIHGADDVSLDARLLSEK